MFASRREDDIEMPLALAIALRGELRGDDLGAYREVGLLLDPRSRVGSTCLLVSLRNIWQCVSF